MVISIGALRGGTVPSDTYMSRRYNDFMNWVCVPFPTEFSCAHVEPLALDGFPLSTSLPQ